MKRIALIGFALLAGAAQADVLFTETFSYPNGDLVPNGGWATHSGSGLPIQVVDGQAKLAHPATTSTSAQDVNKGFTPLAAGQTVYAGFDVTNSMTANAVYFAHFLQGTSTFRARTFITPGTTGDFTYGLSDTASVNQTWASDFAFGSTQRLVISYSYDTGETRLWVNPVDMSSPSLVLTGITSTPVEAFALRQSSGSSMQLIDNVIVATTFGEAIPAPGSAALMLAGLAMAARRRR